MFVNYFITLANIETERKNLLRVKAMLCLLSIG